MTIIEPGAKIQGAWSGASKEPYTILGRSEAWPMGFWDLEDSEGNVLTHMSQGFFDAVPEATPLAMAQEDIDAREESLYANPNGELEEWHDPDPEAEGPTEVDLNGEDA